MDAVFARGRPPSVREEEILGLLAGFPDCESGYDRELSFSDMLAVDTGAASASCRASGAADDQHVQAASPREEEAHRSKTSPDEEAATNSKQQREQATAARKRRHVSSRQQRSGRGSCGGGGGGDGVLLNFYVPAGLLTRSVTAPRPGRGALPPGDAPAKAAAVAAGACGRARAQAPVVIGCFWPALWGRGRDRRRTTAKACS